jgi:heme-degrading monooxygenase HmoA
MPQVSPTGASMRSNGCVLSSKTREAKTSTSRVNNEVAIRCVSSNHSVVQNLEPGATVNFTGTWKNELGSTMTLVQTGGTLAGEYESAVSSDGSTTIGDLQGYADGDLIAFVVHWRDFEAITAWAGQLEPGSSPETIETLWQMAKQVAVGEEWSSINAGADKFVRQ